MMVRLRVRDGFNVQHREPDGWRAVRPGATFRTTTADAERLIEHGIAERVTRWWSRG
jgi:hypothetical protein